MKLLNKALVTLFVSCMLLFVLISVEPLQASQDEKAYHFGFKRSVNGQLPSIAQEGFDQIIKNNDALFLGNTNRKVLYLTIDNGYENVFTAPILDILKRKQVPATFFVTGHYVKDQSELIQRMVAEGHLIGNHSWSHPDMTTMSDEQIRQELSQVKDQVAKLTGNSVMSYLRPPRGIFNDRVLRISREEGYVSVFWSLAYKDWEVNNQKGSDYAYQQVMKQLHPGAIMLIHSVSSDNAGALERIIDDARAQGYSFESLENLMHDRILAE